MMAKNPHRPGTSASNSFSSKQAAFVVQLLTRLMRGEDVRTLVQTREAGQVLAKFQRMQDRMATARRKEGNHGGTDD